MPWSDRCRVEEVEATDEWKAWEDGYRRRSASSGRRNAEADKAEPKTELGRGRNGYYPVLRRKRGTSAATA